MRNWTFLLLLLGLVSTFALQAQPKVSISYSTFLSGENPFVELSLSVERSSLVPDAEGVLATDMTIMFSDDAGQIRKAEKVRLIAPAGDSARTFIEALRYPLSNGEYKLSVEAVDVHANDKLPLKLSTKLTLDYPSEKTQLSDIQLIAARREIDEATGASGLVKGGFVLEPLAQNFVRRQLKGFTAYVEAYTAHAPAGEPFVLEYKVLQMNGQGEEARELVRKTKRFKASAEATPFFIGISTAKLPSGRYALSMDIRDRSLQSMSSKTALFTVANPELDVRRLSQRTEGIENSFAMKIPLDSVEYVLRAVLPTLPVKESEYVSSILSGNNEDAMRLAIFNHFYGESSVVPETAYRAYMKVAREIDVAFQAGFGYGFQTDRGHIYLKYGQPDDRVVINDDPSAPPYEIWVYNYVELTQQTPGKFLFINQTLDNATYTLLHSTVRGEIFEPQWRRILYSRSAEDFGDVDGVQGTDVADNLGRYADQFFEDF